MEGLLITGKNKVDDGRGQEKSGGKRRRRRRDADDPANTFSSYNVGNGMIWPNL